MPNFLILLIFVLFINVSVFSQDDTIAIKKITISDKKQDTIPEFVKTKSLADFLSNKTSFYIKKNGINGLASISVYGTPANHTGFFWNEIELNSPMNGQTDISIFSNLFSDEVQINTTIGATEKNFGYPGGVISLKSNFYNPSNIKIKFGSFNTYGGYLTYGKKQNFFIKGFVFYSLNNFKYKNFAKPNQPLEEIENAQTQQLGFEFGKKIKVKNNIFIFNTLATQTIRFFPPLMTFSGISRLEKQKDQIFLFSADWIKNLSSLKIKTKFGYYYHSLFYFLGDSIFIKPDEIGFLTKNNSISRENSYQIKSEISKRYGKSFHKFFVRLKIENAQFIDNIIKNKYQAQRVNLNFHYQYSRDFKILRLKFNSDVPIVNKKILKPHLSIFFVLKNAELSTGINYHLPTLNDLYWIPGGNPNLKNETVFSNKLTYRFGKKSIKIENTIFYNHTENLIIWKPTEFYYWTPENIKKTISYGDDFNVNFAKKINQTELNFALHFTYTKSIDKTEGSASYNKQIIYMPLCVSSQNLKISKKNFSIMLAGNYVGKRYTTSDNSEFYSLPSYYIFNLFLGYKIKSFSINLTVENILNTYYTPVLYKPMPGRFFMIELSKRF